YRVALEAVVRRLPPQTSEFQAKSTGLPEDGGKACIDFIYCRDCVRANSSTNHSLLPPVVLARRQSPFFAECLETVCPQEIEPARDRVNELERAILNCCDQPVRRSANRHEQHAHACSLLMHMREIPHKVSSRIAIHAAA